MNCIDALAAFFKNLTLFDGDFPEKATQMDYVIGF